MAKNKTDRPELLVFIRHAESARNKVRRTSHSMLSLYDDEESRRGLMGIPDHLIQLTPEGIEQARKTGEALRQRFGLPSYVYHSGYRRTVETAENVLKAYSAEELAQIKVRQHLFIRERDPGYTYDMTNEEAEKHFPFLKEYWKTFGGFFARPIGGESLAQMTERAYMFLNMLFRDRAGQKVFVVTHGGTLRCFRFLLEHWDYEQALRWPPGQGPKNCGVTVYRYDRKLKRLILQEYNTVLW